MTNLEQILEDFQEYVFHEDKKIFDHILPNSRMTAEERASIYAEGFYLRLVEVLTIDYPMIQKLMGDEAFEKLGMAYVKANTPNHFSVNLFGRHMAKFLRSEKKIEPFYADMAEFEWELQLVLNTADGPQITIDELAKIPPESWGFMQFKLHPSVSTLDFNHNVSDVWRALNDDKKPSEFQRYDQGVTHIFWRFELKAYFVPIDLQQAWMLQAIREGKTFGEICEGLLEWISEDDVAQFAAQTLHGWISEGLFSEIQLVS